MKKLSIILGLITLVAFNACKKHDDHDHDDHDHDNELITTIKLHYVEVGTSDTLSFAWRQPAGPGTAVTVDTIKLQPGKTYNGMVEFLDESKSPVVNVTNEIKATANEHRVVYASTTTRVQTQITDFDTHTPPIELGLTWNVSTNANGAESGNYQVILRHYTSASPKTGGIQNGSSDADVIFPILVK